jgi:hypothetical protein
MGSQLYFEKHNFILNYHFPARALRHSTVTDFAKFLG